MNHVELVIDGLYARLARSIKGGDTPGDVIWQLRLRAALAAELTDQICLQKELQRRAQ